MKSNRGVTLISLMVYIIVLSAAVGMISIFTKYFYRNIDETTITNIASEQHSRFIQYFTNDVNSGKIKTITNDVPEHLYFTLENDTVHQYVYENNNIYYKEESESTSKNILLCSNVENCTFEQISNSRVKVSIKIGSITHNNTFTIK